MRSHRLGRLALLTQGVALVSFSSVACNDPPRPNAPPKDDPHMNATAEPTPSATSSEQGVPPTALPPPHMNAPADTGPTALPPPHMNAPVGTGRAASASASAQPPLPKPPSHTNAPPKR